MTPSKLDGSHYQNCPLCNIRTDVHSFVEMLEGQIKDAYRIISQRNEMIDELQKQVSSLKGSIPK